MGTILGEVEAFTASVTAPDDGDDMTAASIGVPLQALTNRARFLYNRRPVAWGLQYDPVVTLGIFETLATSGGAERAILTQTIAVTAGDLLLVTSSLSLAQDGAFGDASVTHSINIGGAMRARQRATSRSSGVGGVEWYKPLTLTTAYLCPTTGNVDVVQAARVISGHEPTMNESTHLGILRVRP